MIIYYTENYAGGRNESRRLLKRAISGHTGDPCRAEQLLSGLRTGEHGKPYIEGFDHFSVSHTGSVWAVLFDTRECGLDIQFSKDCDFTAIARRLYAPEDAAVITGVTEYETADPKSAFFRLWTRREALAKAMGVSVYYSQLPSVSADELSIGSKTYRLTDICFPQGLPADGEKLHAAVCTETVSAGENSISIQITTL